MPQQAPGPVPPEHPDVEEAYHEFRGPGDILKTRTEQYARSTAREAGAYVKHGANDNMVHSKSSAIAPHDKGR